jgi:hypothetical protein
MSRKVQELKCEIDTDKERNLNLVRLTLHIVLHHISICSLQEHVRHLFQEVFQMKKDKDFLLANGPSAEDLKLFTETGSSGPDPFDLCWDFDHSASSDWNQMVISMLVCKLAGLREEEKWTTAPKMHSYWVEAITQKFNHIRTVVSKAKPCILDSLSAETNDQVAKRLVRAKEESQKKARWDSRRMLVSDRLIPVVFAMLNKIQKYKHRLQAITLASQVNEENGKNEDTHAWRFLCGVVQTLGSDGMSSDESGVDDMEPIFFTSLVPWRRDMGRELKIIDSSHSPTTKGAKAAKHVKSTNVTSRTLVKGLPPPFYNSLWLEKNQKMASKDTFQWLELVAL